MANRYRRILDRALDEVGGVFYEPFVGGFNVIPSIGRRITATCSDVHPGLKPFYDAIKAGWSPPQELGREEWERLRRDQKWSDPRTAFAGFAMSFGGVCFDTFAVDGDYCFASAAARAIERKRHLIEASEFLCCDFRHVPTVDEGVIYCDPPYRGAKGYKGTGPFDHSAFDRWCERKASQGHIVFVSEFEAPDDWELVWETRRQVSMAREGRRERFDKLFLVPGSRLSGVFDVPARVRQTDLFE